MPDVTLAFALCAGCVRQGESLTCPVCRGWGVVARIGSGRQYAPLPVPASPDGAAYTRDAVKATFTRLRSWADALTGANGKGAPGLTATAVDSISRWVAACPRDPSATAFVFAGAFDSAGEPVFRPVFTPLGK